MMESLPSGYPIRSSAYHRMFVPPRSFSQLTTTFFALQLQDIHHKPIFHLTILSFSSSPLSRSTFSIIFTNPDLFFLSYIYNLKRFRFLIFHSFLFLFPFPIFCKRTFPRTNPQDGDKGGRTPDLRLAKPPLYQLSYIPSRLCCHRYKMSSRKNSY